MNRVREPQAYLRWVLFIVVLFVRLLCLTTAEAQTEGELTIDPSPDLTAYANRTLDEVRVETMGSLWPERIEVRAVKAGDPLEGQLVRRALRELDRTGRYGDLRAELLEEGERLILLLKVRPRRLIANIRWSGGQLEHSEELRALDLRVGDAVTDLTLERAQRSLIALYQASGFPEAKVTFVPEATDDPRRVFLRVQIKAAQPERVVRIGFLVAPSPHHPDITRHLSQFGVKKGERYDEERLIEADGFLVEALVNDNFYEAEVSHAAGAAGELTVFVSPGPKFSVRIEGNTHLGYSELEGRMKLVEDRDPRPEAIEGYLRSYYVKHGFHDATVRVERLNDKAGLRSEIYVWVREGQRFRVVKRIYPCLSGELDSNDVDDEVEGVLAEQFPSMGVLRAVDASSVNQATGTVSPSPRPSPWWGEPWKNSSDESYAAVIDHLDDLYRADGYLDAVVGPASLVRRRCRADSPADECLVDGPPPILQYNCDQPTLQDKKIEHTCVPDLAAGIRCETEGILVLPIYAGKQVKLYDVQIEGNLAFTEETILGLAKFKLGQPLRRAQLDGGLRRIQEKYEEEAYAFAQIDSEIELSADHSRARLVVSITERQQVLAQRIDIRGALLTREGLVRSRLALKEGQPYRRSLVKRTQAQLETLGVFTSVTVGLEDPGVPARQKVVVITVNERLPQYLDIKGGFGSVDGFRIGFEYGHRNLGGEAIQLTIRSQLAIRPIFLIAEEDVRDKYTEERLDPLERRNTITLAFPEIGLGPLFRFEAELLDLRDNQRDYIQTRDSAAIRLLFRPQRQLLMQLGATVELNDALILGGESLTDYVAETGQIIRVPEGRSVAVTQNLTASWDARDKPLSATRGYYVRGGVEHVQAFPLGASDGNCNQESTDVFDPVCSQLFRFSGRVAGYVPLTRSGMTFAMSFRMGVIEHLNDQSRTYPDRLFFMGGVGTLRGYPQGSLVPQDVADELLSDKSSLTIDEVVLRGGDIFINPRAELRIPLTKTIQTALFLDAGNLWKERGEFNPFILRYTAGTGVRIQTPVGPLVFDYGFNLERLVDAFQGEDEKQRDWEDIGAFHFSIGLF